MAQIDNKKPIDLKSKSLFAKLKRLFSTDVVVRNVGGKMLKIKDTDQIQYATDRNTLRDRFNRIRTSGYSQYSRDFTMAYQASRIELFRDYDCVGPDTIIPLPDGSRPTIKELTEKYKDDPTKRFHVFSYDHVSKSIKLGEAYHPRKKGLRVGYKVTFDDGKSITGSDRHPFLMRDGTYKLLMDLVPGDSVMPFYQNEYGYKNHGFKRYRKIYNFSKGWQQEHKIVAEQFIKSIEKGEVVHHKNFNGSDNSPDNLMVMNWKEHKNLHSDHNKNVLWGAANYDIQLNKLLSHPNYINRKINKWNGKRLGNNNPFYGKRHTSESNQLRSKSLKEVFVNRNQYFENNPKFRKDITFDSIKTAATEIYKLNGKLVKDNLVNSIGCDSSVLDNRLNLFGYTWRGFKTEIESQLNHKVVSVECIGELEVYDVTVDQYHNFATDSCFVSNTMDMDPIIASALDIYADECLTQNEMGYVLNVKAEDNNVKRILENLYYDILNIEFNLWSWTRNMCKYGDFYLKLHISPEYGIYLVEPLSAYNVSRVENSDPMNKNYIKYQVNFESGVMEELENYQVAHFRLLSDSNFLPYGKSMIEGARRVWKQLSLMEDAMLIHRIMRAPEKRVFKIDVGNIPPGEIDNFMERTINKMKKVPYIDEKTGDYNLRFNLQNMVEDFYLPVRGGDSGTDIQPLSGMEFTGTDDIEYLRNKMMASLKIPKAFLGYEEDLSGKATLAAEDVRFARTIHRIQKILISELTKIGIVHLYSQGFTDENLVNFSLELTNPSTIFEKEKIDIWGNKVSVAKDMMENKLFSKDWIYKNIFNMSDEDTLNAKNEIVEDAKQSWRFKQIEEEGNDPAVSLQKVNQDGETENLGGEEPTGESEESLGMPGEELGGEEPTGEAGKEETGVSTKPEETPPLAEKTDRPSQKGKKNARDYPFGEDPLGRLENKADYRKNAISHKYKNNSPLGFEAVNFGKLSDFLNKDDKKELLKESSKNKSMMDESNIIDDKSK